MKPRDLLQIEAINAASRAIMAGRLGERIPVLDSTSEIGELRDNLNQLFDRVQSLLESQKEASTNIAHDLRTPLSRLSQHLHVARRERPDSIAHENAIDAAIAESDQLQVTFSSLLRIAQIESGSRKSAFKRIDLTELFERVTSAYQAVAEDEGKAFVVTLAGEAACDGDSGLLLQMTANLVENAIRHTPPSTKIQLSLQHVDNTVVSVIADSGPGIPADQYKKVFQRFYRLDSSRSTAGNGLGLTVVAAIADLHGIAIELSDNNPGLKVTLTFKPVARLSPCGNVHA